MRVEDVLRSKNHRIVMIRMNETVETASRLMKAENIGALVVKDVCRTEGNTVVGMFSERDIVRALLEHGARVLQMPVSSLMSRKLITCALDRQLGACAGADGGQPHPARAGAGRRYPGRSGRRARFHRHPPRGNRRAGESPVAGTRPLTGQGDWGASAWTGPGSRPKS